MTVEGAAGDVEISVAEASSGNTGDIAPSAKSPVVIFVAVAFRKNQQTFYSVKDLVGSRRFVDRNHLN